MYDMQDGFNWNRKKRHLSSLHLE